MKECSTSTRAKSLPNRGLALPPGPSRGTISSAGRGAVAQRLRRWPVPGLTRQTPRQAVYVPNKSTRFPVDLPGRS